LNENMNIKGVEDMDNRVCEYKLCLEKATTKGFVLVRGKDGNHIPEPVLACDKHKNHPSFFEEN
jgi:hypothetical protein